MLKGFFLKNKYIVQLVITSDLVFISGISDSHRYPKTVIIFHLGKSFFLNKLNPKVASF